MLKFGAVCLFTLVAVNLDAFHLIELKSGGQVQGELVLERPEAYYIDLGFDVLQIPKAAVHSAAKVDSETGLMQQSQGSGERLYEMGSEVKDQSIRDWVEQIGEAVALVQTPTGLGSGFVVHQDGYIVTNDHVVAGEHRISVTIFEQGKREMKRQTYDNVSIVAISSDLDLALLKIEQENLEPFKTVPIAAVDALSEGQTVFAIGSPLGLDRTVSEGIISVANRVIGGRLYLQTTTQINSGNSGGPLFNLRGEVVGVNNMKIAAVGAEGLGFSISSRVLKSFLDNRDAYAFDPRNPNAGFRYMSPPKAAE